MESMRQQPNGRAIGAGARFVKRNSGVIAGSFDTQYKHAHEIRRKRFGGAFPVPRALLIYCRTLQNAGSSIGLRTRGNGIMPTVRVKENEPFEVAMRRFKRTVEKTGLLTELRAREFYEKPTSERKRKKAAAIKRHFKRLRGQQMPPRLY